MKKLIFAAALALMGMNQAQCQTWKSMSKTSDFDGNMKIAFAEGYGGRSPYENPTMLIRNYEDQEGFEIIFADLGYTCGGGEIQVVFDGETRMTLNGSPSTDNSAMFISSAWQGMIKVELSEFLGYMQSSNRMAVRYINDCGMKTYAYRLDGATKAINFALDLDAIKDSELNEEALNESLVSNLWYEGERVILDAEQRGNLELSCVIIESVTGQKVVGIKLDKKKSILGGHDIIYELDDRTMRPTLDRIVKVGDNFEVR